MQYGCNPHFQYSRGDPWLCTLPPVHMFVLLVVSWHVHIQILDGVVHIPNPLHKKTQCTSSLRFCNGCANGEVRSISCEVEDGVQQPQLNVRYTFSGSTSTILSPIGVPSLQNFKQHQKDRKRDMEKFTKLSMKSFIGVIDQVGPHFRCQVSCLSTTCSCIASYEGILP